MYPRIGNQVDPLINADCKSIIPRLKPSLYPQDKVYVMMDGSMIFTRDNEWRELKLGRLFYSGQVVDIQAKRREVLNSVYVGHLGSVDHFFPKFERHLLGYNKKVIIGDGAKWIWNWVRRQLSWSYPNTRFLSCQGEIGSVCPISIQRRTGTCAMGQTASR